MKNIRAHLLLFAGSLTLGSVLYPAVLWAFAQTLFPTTANGRLVTKADGTVVGSATIAQAFTRDGYFWPRPSAAGYNAAATGGSNWGANNPKLRDRVARQLGPVVRYKNRQPVGPDVEAWFAAAPDRAARWAAAYPTAAADWAKADVNGRFVRQWAADHPELVAGWKRANPTTADEPNPEDLVGGFFDGYAKAHPGTFPGVVGGTVQPVKVGPTIQALFFDLWLQDPSNGAKAADLEPVPADAVTASGAGVDPHITLRNARWQLDRVAAARAATRGRIEAILDRHAAAPLGGLAGEPLVNVLEVNLALDAEFAGGTR